MGLDAPWPQQYLIWIGHVLQGDLGRSYINRLPIAQLIAQAMPATIQLALIALGLAVLVGIPSGIISAVWRGRPVDQTVSGLAMLAANIPSFWLGLIFIQLFAVKLGWFPVAGYGAPEAGFAERLRHLLLPAAVLTM